MLRRLHPYAFVAALGLLLQLGLSGAAVWCKAMGLLPACCCPDQTDSQPALQAPSDCCRPVLQTTEVGPGEARFTPEAQWDAIPWERPVTVEREGLAFPSEPTPQATPPPIPLISTVVLLC
ncbi:MAG: hypothetical protein DIU72_003425 [Pseudomonadota bacterium]